MQSSYSVGIVGATGAVGVELIKCLEKRKFPVSELHLYASAKSSGRMVPTSFGDIVLKEYSLEDARKCHIVFLAVSGDFALAHAKVLTEGDGPIVIDNSSAFRYDNDIPLVVRHTVRCITVISVATKYISKYTFIRIILSGS